MKRKVKTASYYKDKKNILLIEQKRWAVARKLEVQERSEVSLFSF